VRDRDQLWAESAHFMLALHGGWTLCART